MLAAKPGLHDLALTTNGVLLADQVDALQAAGLQPHHGQPRHAAAAIASARSRASTSSTRSTTGIAAAHARLRRAQDRHGRHPRRQRRRAGRSDRVRQARVDAEVRFIEYMDVGGATQLVARRASSRGSEMLDALAAHYGPIAPIVERVVGAGRSLRAAGRHDFGIIASTTEPFCRTCDRSRLTADGMWYLCLYATRGLDLRGAAARAARRRRADGADRATAGARATIAAPRSASRSAIAARSCRCRIC